MIRLIFLLLFCSLFSLSHAGNKDQKILGTLTPMRTCFDVTHYGIEVKVEPEKKFLSGVNIISFVVTQAFRKMQLDLVEAMKIDSIHFEKKPVSFLRKKNIIVITLEKELLKGEQHKLSVFFSGHPHVAELPPWKGGFVWSKDPAGNDWVGLACEGIGASVWLPCKDHWSDEADSMDMFLTVPQKLTGVSNGKLINQSNSSGGFRTFHWHVGNTINNYNISINIGKYTEIKDVFDGINQLSLSYFVLENNKTKAENHFKQVHGMLKAFEHYFGTYPFPEDGYKLVETPYWGMEHQSCIAYGNNYKNNSFDFDFIIIHESGHEWYANSITASDPADMWIHESFTTYSEALYVEYFYGKEKAIEYLQTQKGKVVGKQPLQGPRNEYYHGRTDNDIYYKGTWMLHTMRNVLDNDSLWFAALKNLTMHFRHRIIRTEDVLSYFNAATGKNWDVFFKQYIYQGAVPELEYKIKKLKDGSQEVKYRWKRTAKGFSIPVMVYTSPGTSVIVTPSHKYNKIHLDANANFTVATERYLIAVKSN